MIVDDDNDDNIVTREDNLPLNYGFLKNCHKNLLLAKKFSSGNETYEAENLRKKFKFCRPTIFFCPNFAPVFGIQSEICTVCPKIATSHFTTDDDYDY